MYCTKQKFTIIKGEIVSHTEHCPHIGSFIIILHHVT